MAGLTYDLGLNTADQDDTPDTTPGRTTPYVPAAPGVDPKTSPEKVRPFDHVQNSKVRPDVPANHPPSVSHSRDGIERKYVRKPIECAH